ncbi:MAG: energy transducer TonB [Acidobacteriota bacterium]|nr:energy transducer TonB [Acidobacteriota bacterium]MDQ5873605.1 energy transducer TonB [Acidobacteriota bacterium]
MRDLRRSPVVVIGVAALVLALTGCATVDSKAPPPCTGFVPAKPKMLRSPEYPAPAVKARMSGESTHEVIVDRAGKVRDARIVGTTFMVFALAADTALRKSTYFPAELEGRPVATRFWVRVPFGTPKGVESSPARNRVTAFVPGDEPGPARWQLKDAVDRVTLAGDIASAPPAEVAVIGIASGGQERVLLPAGKVASRRLRATVKTGDFFSRAGEYLIQLRQGDKTIAEGGFTVAESESTALVNACGAE